MTRYEHIAWCKKRALEYLDRGDIENAIASMGSDMSQHPDCKIADGLMLLGMMIVVNQDGPGARDFIEGFH